jgi:opacity protein-like surface antigen
MRNFLIAAAFATALATPALAAPVALTPATASPEFQKKLADDLGVRELADLADYAQTRLARELTARGAQVGGAGGLTITVVIHDAKPNKPTMRQLSARPGLSYGLSYSIGGADLEATITDAAGRSETVRYKWYETDITEAWTSWTWSDAQRAIRRFAVEVAKAYAAAPAPGAS